MSDFIVGSRSVSGAAGQRAAPPQAGDAPSGPSRRGCSCTGTPPRNVSVADRKKPADGETSRSRLTPPSAHPALAVSAGRVKRASAFADSAFTTRRCAVLGAAQEGNLFLLLFLLSLTEDRQAQREVANQCVAEAAKPQRGNVPLVTCSVYQMLALEFALALDESAVPDECRSRAGRCQRARRQSQP